MYDDKTAIETIAQHYGEKCQVIKACEELSECISALCVSLHADENDVDAFMHLAEEMADARIMLDQIEFLLDLRTQCDYWREFKLKRQLDRMSKEIN